MKKVGCLFCALMYDTKMLLAERIFFKFSNSMHIMYTVFRRITKCQPGCKYYELALTIVPKANIKKM